MSDYYLLIEIDGRITIGKEEYPLNEFHANIDDCNIWVEREFKFDTKLEAMNKAYRIISSKIRELENIKDDIFEQIIMERNKENE